MEQRTTGDIESAINCGQLLEQARQKPISLPNGNTGFVIQDNQQIAEIEPPTAILPDNIIQAEVLIEQASFCAYVNRFKRADTVIFANPDGRMKAVLDYHHGRDEMGGDEPSPDHAKHIAFFETAFDPNYERWRNIDRKDLNQQEFAYFVEEMLHTIAKPDGADLLEMAQTLKIIRGVTFSQNVKLKNGTADIQYKEEDETRGASGVVSVPDEVLIISPVYMMRPAQTITAKLRYRISPDKPLSFRIDIMNRKLVELEAFQVMCKEVSEATDCPVYLSGRL